MFANRQQMLSPCCFSLCFNYEILNIFYILWIICISFLWKLFDFDHCAFGFLEILKTGLQKLLFIISLYLSVRSQVRFLFVCFLNE